MNNKVLNEINFVPKTIMFTIYGRRKTVVAFTQRVFTCSFSIESNRDLNRETWKDLNQETWKALKY